MTATPPCEIQRQQLGLPVVDEIVARTAKDLGVKVIGLETVAEQTDALASLDPAVSVTALISAAKRPVPPSRRYEKKLSRSCKITFAPGTAWPKSNGDQETP